MSPLGRPWLVVASLIGCGPSGGGAGGHADAVTDEGDGTDTSGAELPSEPVGACGGVPVGGRCNGNAVEFCAAATGSADTRLASYACTADEICRDDGGQARCELVGECFSGGTECRGAALATCVGGRWQTSPCASGCVASEFGANCRSGASAGRYQGRLTYELKPPNQALSDWSPTPVQVPAAGFLVLSFADGVLIDATVTSTASEDAGRFEIDAVPAELVDGDDYLAAVAARGNASQQLIYLVAKSGFSPGRQDVSAVPPAPDYWLWTWTPAQIRSPGEVNIPLDAGSGAAFVFDYLRFVYDASVDFYGERLNAPLVVWLDYGVDWSCGACMGPWRYADPGGAVFERQIWLSGGADEGFWSGAVVAHELGHYLMATYGVWPGEGGQHIIGLPSHPGLAWSEGFATWFSTVVRGDTVYYDKQQGAFFWFDLARRAYSNTTWNRPVADFGLEQLIDENEVAAMLLALTREETLGGLLAAIASPRMTQPPYLRGYRRRVWDGLDQQGLPLPFQSSQESAPHFADFLDTVVCGGVAPPVTVDQVTEPFVHYPFPSGAPLCRSGRAPIAARWTDDGALELAWHWALASALVVALDGEEALVLPAGTPPGAHRIPATHVSFAEISTGSSGDPWGASVRVSREPPRALTVQATGPLVRIGERVLGRGVALRPTSPPAPTDPDRGTIARPP